MSDESRNCSRSRRNRPESRIQAALLCNWKVYAYPGLTDVNSITDATVFSYTSGVVNASEGDTVFYRGVNGYYGAWRIDDIHDYKLDGHWYFQDDQTGNFQTSFIIPEPSTLLVWSLLAALGIGTAAYRRKRQVGPAILNLGAPSVD